MYNKLFPLSHYTCSDHFFVRAKQEVCRKTINKIFQPLLADAMTDFPFNYWLIFITDKPYWKIFLSRRNPSKKKHNNLHREIRIWRKAHQHLWIFNVLMMQMALLTLLVIIPFRFGILWECNQSFALINFCREIMYL